MKNNKTKIHNLSIDEYDEINNPPPEVVDFDNILQKAMRRRSFMKRSEERRVGKEGRSRWSRYH